MELLAPAGGWEAFLAAVHNGADAVYLGGKAYSARQFAANFDFSQLESATLYAHQHGVKLYVTLNTLLREEELPQAVDYAAKLYALGIDGLIVTDLGLISVLREALPDLPLHASTQMTLHEENAVRYLASLGLRRVVLARELSLPEIASIARTGIETEVFIHGALCICYSGQCLFSSLIGGRSGNRGRCAQPCRLPYTLLDPKGGEVKAGHLLSPKDLCCLPALPQLQEAGVKSLKIEGRMKRPEYVATVVRTYREALDKLAQGGPLPGDEELLQIFNRGFTTGYLFQNPGADLMSYQRPNNRGVPVGRIKEYLPQKRQALISLDSPLTVGDGIEVWVSKGRVGATVEKMLDQRGKPLAEAQTGQVWVELSGRVSPGDRVFRTADKRLLDRAAASYEKEARLPLSFTLKGKVGAPVTLKAEAGGTTVEIQGEAVAESARKRALDAEIAARHLFKLGDTPFSGGELILDLEGALALPPSELNRLRRKAAEALSAKISGARKLPPTFRALSFSQAARKSRKPLLTVKVGEGLWRAALNAGADLIYLPAELSDLEEALTAIASAGRKAFLAWPRISSQAETRRYAALVQSAPYPDGILLGHLGQVLAAQTLGLPLASDFGFNVMNSKAAAQLFSRGISRVTLSVELRHEQIGELLAHNDGAFEVIAGGDLPVMITKHCPVGSAFSTDCGCELRPCSQGTWYLKDRLGIKFPLQQDAGCRTTIYNSHQLSVLEELPTILNLGLSALRIEAPLGNASAWEKEIALYRAQLDAAWDNPDYRAPAGIREEEEKIFGVPITRGHFFRGVD